MDSRLRGNDRVFDFEVAPHPSRLTPHAHSAFIPEALTTTAQRSISLLMNA